jgi:hypothetical protein
MHVIVKHASLPLFFGIEPGDPPGNIDLNMWKSSPFTSLLVVSPRAAMTMQRTPSGLATTIQGDRFDADVKSSGIETKYSGMHSWSANRSSDFKDLDFPYARRESGANVSSTTISAASGD